MKTVKPITKFKQIITATVGFAVLAIVSTISVVNVSAWGPERTTYTNANPADYATFNSITDGAIGDERNFVRIREANIGNYTDEIEVVPGKEYEVYIYYHNNAASDTNTQGYGTATNTHMASAFPTVVNTNERGMISGIITWSYVTPSSPNDPETGKVWDEAYVTTKTDGTVLRYKTGTAIIHNDGQANGSVLPGDLFEPGGTPIGYNKLGGSIPGCAEYSGYVTYILVAENPDSTIDKQVSVDGSNWSDEVTVKPGDFVTYKVAFKNIGNTNFTNAIFTDSHDSDLLLRAGSTKFYNVDNPDGKTIDDIIDISGYSAGDVRAGALVQFIYQMQVRNDVSLCGKTLTNTMTVKYNTTPDERTDSTSVKVACEEATPDKIVETGPLEIVMATVVVLAIAGAGIYFWHTRRTLKTVENKVSGKETITNADKNIQNNPENSNIDQKDQTSQDESENLGQDPDQGNKEV